jgi:vacuolar-type H+-ATPase subunit H
VRQATIIAPLAISVLLAQAAQSPIVTITLGPDQIGLVKTAQGITTRIAFPEPVKEVVCGDLYDPGSGRGSFVVQPSGNDAFLKPVVSKGISNLFVKTGQKSENIYSFDLKIVSPDEAYRVVNVIRAPEPTNPTAASESRPRRLKSSQESEQPRAESELERMRQEAIETLQAARQQAEKIITEAEAKANSTISRSAQIAGEEAERRFVNALMLGLRELKVAQSRLEVKNIRIMLDPRVLTFGDKSYLRYRVQNMGGPDFVFSGVSLEAGDSASMRKIESTVVQNKSENLIKAGEAITGLIVFDANQIRPEDGVTFYLRGENGAEIARLVVRKSQPQKTH